MRTRFAPSPTGLMHFGNLRTALFNYLLAKHCGEAFVLRIEDTDQTRNKPEYVEALKKDLNWVGVTWDDGPYFQSQRADLYDRYYQQLIEEEHAYPCFCSEQHLAMVRKSQLSAGQPPRYSGTCRNLSEQERQNKLAEGIEPTLRFHVKRDQLIEFEDLVKGKQKFQSNDIGDFIIRRADGTASFMFCNAIDDAEMNITHALRGDDHLTNTPRQLLILQALDKKAPKYGHFPMINGMDGSPLSKRNGSASVVELCEVGYHPLAVLNYLARLGHNYEQNELLTLKQLGEHFSLEYISKSPAKHDPSHFKHWQKEAVMAASTQEVWTMIAPHVEKVVPESEALTFTETIQENILMPSDASEWAQRLYQEPQLDDDAKNVLAETPAEFWEIATKALDEKFDYQYLTQQLKYRGFKGKKLFMPIRVALSGTCHGPQLETILKLLGPERAKQRFEIKPPAVRSDTF